MEGIRDLLKKSLRQSLNTLCDEDKLAAAWPVIAEVVGGMGKAIANACEIAANLINLSCGALVSSVAALGNAISAAVGAMPGIAKGGAGGADGNYDPLGNPTGIPTPQLQRFNPGTYQSPKPQPVSPSLNVDGRTLAQAISSQLSDLMNFPTGAPTADGYSQWHDGDHNKSSI